jgi:O-antigen/teichoic acid export membrane protein
MVLTVGLGILTTRLLLKHLGASDYGVWAAILSLTSLAVFPLQALRVSSQRHLSLAVGENSDDSIRRTFNSMLVLFTAVALLIGVAGFGAAAFAPELLDVPKGRETAAITVFCLVVGTTAANTLATPLLHLVIAHQDMHVIAGLELASSATRLLTAMALPYLSGDNLILLVAILFFWTLLFHFILFFATQRLYSSICIDLRLSSITRIKKAFGFASWSSLEAAAWRGVNDGNAIVLNRSFGPEANAAYAVAMQLAAYLTSVTGILQRVVEPAAIAAYARKQHENFASLILAICKYSITIACGLSFILMFWTSQVLDLWLTNVPEYAVVMTRLIVAGICLDLLTRGYVTALIAGGNISLYGMTQVAFFCFVATGSFVAISFLHFSPAIAGYTVLSMYILTAIYRVFVTGSEVAVPFPKWGQKVLLPSSAVIMTVAVGVWLVTPLVERSAAFIVPAIGVFTIIAVVLAWPIVLTADERDRYRSFMRQVLRRRNGSAGRESTAPEELP